MAILRMCSNYNIEKLHFTIDGFTLTNANYTRAVELLWTTQQYYSRNNESFVKITSAFIVWR